MILIGLYVFVQEAESHAYSYCNLKENIYFLSPISLNGERFALTAVVKELPGQRVRHIGDDCLVVGHAGHSKNWKYAKQCQTLPNTAKHCQTMPNHAKQFQTMPNSAKPCQSVPNHAKRCQTLPNPAKQCQTMPDSAKPRQTMPNHAKPC